MAKKAVKSVDMTLLSLIVAATNQGHIHYVTKDEADAAGLEHNPPLIQVNTKMLDTQGKAAARATAEGITMVHSHSTSSASATNGASPFGLIKGAILPPSQRGVGLRGGGAPKKYPFESMEVGDSFFVPVSAELPNPVKTLGSTVSSANLRFANEVGTREVTRKKRGPDRKAMTNPDGSFVMETVTVPVHQFTKKFAIRPVKAGNAYGNWTAEADGALIARVE